MTNDFARFYRKETKKETKFERKHAMKSTTLLDIVESSQQHSGFFSPIKTDSSKQSFIENSAKLPLHKQPGTIEACLHGDPVGHSQPSANLSEWEVPDDSQSFAEQELEEISPIPGELD